MTTIAVFGASGYIGSHLVPRLGASGGYVRAIARRLDVLQDRGWTDVETVAADALDPNTLGPALANVDTAYYLVHSMSGGEGFAERDRQAATNFRQAAERAGVGRIIYLGGLQPAGDSSAHLRSRGETGAVLRAGAVPVIEVRAGIIVGAGSAGFEVIRDLVNHLPIMTTPRWVKSKTQPIALDDLLSYLLGLASIDVPANAIFDVAGTETLSYAELITQYGRVVGKRRLIVPLPVLSPRLSSYWLDLVTSVPASVARPLIDGLKHDLVADDRAIRALLPIPLHTYREAVEAALREERDAPLPARWTEGSLAFRGYNPSVSFYSKGEETRTEVAAPAHSTWDIIRSIGGANGYGFADSLWRLRGAMDRLAGGVGMRRGRRHPVQLRVGDAIDFWRVAAIEPGRRLTLVAEMRLPGVAILELAVEPRGEDRSTIVMTARFHPSGVGGLLYWYAMVPAHFRIFREMPRGLARRAEWLWAVEKARAQ